MAYKTIKALVRNRIKEVRIARGISRYALQQAIEKPHPYITQVEKQNFQPPLPVLAKICKALQCSPKELIELDFRPIEKML